MNFIWSIYYTKYNVYDQVQAYRKTSAVNNSNKVDIESVPPRTWTISLILIKWHRIFNASAINTDIQPSICGYMGPKSSGQFSCSQKKEYFSKLETPILQWNIYVISKYTPNIN